MIHCLSHTCWAVKQMTHSHRGFVVIKWTAVKYFLALCLLMFCPGRERDFGFCSSQQLRLQKKKFLLHRGEEEVANPSSVAPGWMSSSSQLQLFSASLHPLPLRTPPASLLAQRPVVTGDRQTSEPVARLTYTYSGHELMKCTHCWGLLANTCALVCAHTRAHIIAHRDTLTNTALH